MSADPVLLREGAHVKCLSVRQPWAELIVRGVKDVENRSWATPYRGTMAIHAGGIWADDGFDAARRDYGVVVRPDECVRGAIIGVVDLLECTEAQASRWHVAGQVGWYLANPRRLVEPVPCKGRLRLFETPDELILRDLPPYVDRRTNHAAGR